MRILIAPDSFKGSLAAPAVVAAIRRGLEDADPGAISIEGCPLADGGEGTLDVLLAVARGLSMHAVVDGPFGDPVEARWGWLEGDVAVVESAQACGLEALPEGRRDVMRATTVGVGQLIEAALDHAPSRLVVTLGGSATVDGGLGMLHALGARLLDASGATLAHEGALTRLARIDLSSLDPRLSCIPITALCDVSTPLLGARGARLYMAQKGADASQKDALEAGLERVVRGLQTKTHAPLATHPGGGAAGGLGAALLALGATLEPGAEFIAERVGLDALIAQADVVIGGEGWVDEQTMEGKVMAMMAARCARLETPLILLCGGRAAELSALYDAGVTAVFSIASGPTSRAAALAETAASLTRCARDVARLLLASRGRKLSLLPRER